MLIQTQVTELITIYVFSTTLSQDETKGTTLLQTDTLNNSYDGHLPEVYISVVTGLDQEYRNYLLDKYFWTRKASHTVWEGRPHCSGFLSLQLLSTPNLREGRCLARSHVATVGTTVPNLIPSKAVARKGQSYAAAQSDYLYTLWLQQYKTCVQINYT